MRRTLLILAVLILLPLTVSVKAQPPLGGTVTYGLWLEKGHRATTAQTIGADITLPVSSDSSRFRVVNRAGILNVDRDVGEIQGAFEVVLIQQFIPLGRGVDTYAQSGVGIFNQFVIDGEDQPHAFGVFEIGINLWRIISVGVGTNIIFQDEGNQYDLYTKLDFMRMPL